MDAWARMFQQEADTLAFLLQEEFTEDIMQKSTITRLQEEACNAYNRVPQSEAPPFLQAAMLAEIVLQLAKQNEFLENIAEQLHTLVEFEAVK